MINRDYKEFSPGEFYHVYNRGVGKMNIFIDEEDYNFFLNRLFESVHPEMLKNLKFTPRRKLLPENSFELTAYCLMPNHYHILIKQIDDLPISLLMSKVCTSYSMYFNKKYERVGSLYQDIFKCVRVESNAQLLWLSAYIHNNPVKSKIVNDPFSYKWSSAKEYLDSSTKNMCSKSVIMEQISNKTHYKKLLSDELTPKNDNLNLIKFGHILIDE